METLSALRPSRAKVLDLRGLGRALGLVARVGVPITLISAVMLGAIHLFYRENPERTRVIRHLSIDYFVVLEQLERARTLSPSLAFFGDSSCLMGIDVSALASHLRNAESFCTLGFIGPVGYAHTINQMINRGAAPKQLVLAFHPVQFKRDPAWEGFTAFVLGGGKFASIELQYPWSALDYLRFEWIAPWLYNPLLGAYGRYYGSEQQFRNTIATSHGSAIDPAFGLTFRSKAQAAAFSPAWVMEATDFSLNEAFRSSLAPLAEAIRKLGAEQVFLVITPVPEAALGPEADAARRRAAQEIASALGLDPDRVLDSPTALPNGYFSSYTHLNRIGRTEFTETIASALQAKSWP